MDNLANMAISKAQTNRYYSLGSGFGGTEPRFDCSLWVRQTLEAQFKNYPNWSLSNKDMWTSEGIFKSCMNVAGSHEEYRNMARHSLLEREQMLLDIVKKVGPGGIIATDKGPTRSGFDVNREYGIDHILRVVEKDGKLYMSHTTVASPRGTHFEPVEEWAHKYAKSVQNVFGVNGEFKNNPKSRQYAMENVKKSLEDNVREFAMTNNIDPRVASAYIKYNDSYEKFAEAVKNIDDNPAATWKKLQDHLAKEAKDRGIEYHFDKNDGLIAKIFAALGMMFTQGMKDQENGVDMAKAQAQEIGEHRPETGGVTEKSPNNAPTTPTQQTERKIAGYKHIIYDNGEVEKVPIYRDQLDEPGKYVYNTLDDMKGETESGHNITSKTIESNGIKKDELDKIAQQNQQNPIKDTATPAHEVDNTPSR